MTDENENRPGRAPLTLKPRTGSSVSTGTVKQSFSHGRSKTVVVETKRPRIGTPPAVNLAAPSALEKRPPAFDVRGPQSRGPQGSQPADAHRLSEDERQRREKVAAEFKRQQAERAAAEERTRAAAAARLREAEPQAPPPAAPIEAPVAEVHAEAPPPVA